MIDRACISLNHRCNLRCQYCHFSSKQSGKSQSEMDFGCLESETVIDNIAKYCCQNDIRKFKLGIVGSGEPLLSFDALAAMVVRAKSIGQGVFRMYTITNGVSLTEEQLQFFKKHSDIIDINFSLDGYEILHNAYRQRFNETMGSILRYEKLFGRKPKINCTVSKQSVIHQDELIRFFIDNNFDRINFSIVSETSDKDLVLTRIEYNAFLDVCEAAGITMRQRENTSEQVYDCAMYGRLCGVGRTNIFIARDGIYPCGRFFGLKEYIIANFDEAFDVIETKLSGLRKVSDGQCYYETYAKPSKKTAYEKMVHRGDMQ